MLIYFMWNFKKERNRRKFYDSFPNGPAISFQKENKISRTSNVPKKGKQMFLPHSSS
jgi:hypothetical protein